MDYKLVELNNRTLKVFENGLILVKKKDIFYEKKCSKINGYLDLELNFDGKRKHYYVHRILAYAFLDLDITDTSKNIDHINRNKQDNHVTNLRVVTHQQNQYNTNAKGYCWNKQNNKWQAQITINGKQIYLGLYDNEDDAHNAYQQAKLIHHIIT